jgi:hypothetical protein
MTLADGDYQLIPEPEGDISEDLGNVIGDLTEAPNPNLEDFINISDPSPTSKGKPRHKPLFYYTATYIFIYIYLCI